MRAHGMIAHLPTNCVFLKRHTTSALSRVSSFLPCRVGGSSKVSRLRGLTRREGSRDCTVIAGPNGSGKSNLLDAIIFVLGSTNANPPQLVYNEGRAGITEASVSILYDNPEATWRLLGYEHLSEIAVTWQVEKSNIEKLIVKLKEKKEETLRDTLDKVNNALGLMVSAILPGVVAKLEPPEGSSFLDGLEVSVAFDGVGKQSLSGVGGGQGSLLALSLLFALQLVKPTPLYIVDEVDAALDFSHIQSVGRMVESLFPHAQLIVVSLKEGMLNNANVLFCTKIVDGVSTVQRTVASKQSKSKQSK